jgi:hypothetical protein
MDALTSKGFWRMAAAAIIREDTPDQIRTGVAGSKVLHD